MDLFSILSVSAVTASDCVRDKMQTTKHRADWFFYLSVKLQTSPSIKHRVLGCFLHVYCLYSLYHSLTLLHETHTSTLLAVSVVECD